MPRSAIDGGMIGSGVYDPDIIFGKAGGGEMSPRRQGQRVEPIPGDLNNFLEWMQDSDLVKEPVKEALLRIELNHREEFERVLRRESWPDDEETKELLEHCNRTRREYLKDLEALEDVFTHRLQLDEEYELAIVPKGIEPTAVNMQDVYLLSDLKRRAEWALANTEKSLLSLTHNKPPSSEIILARIVADFLLVCEPDMLKHTLEIARLLILHDGKLWPDDEEFVEECRALMTEYGIRIRRRTRTEG